MITSNIINNKGNEALNQYTIEDLNFVKFQSYNSLIAIYDKNTKILTFGCDWDYSPTTLKHLKIWLTNNCYSIYNGLEYHKNGKATLQYAIDNDIIQYDGGMR